MFHEKNPCTALLDNRNRPMLPPVLPRNTSPLMVEPTPTISPGTPVHPPTSRVPCGVAVPMPTLPPDSVIAESPSVPAPPLVHFTMTSVVPVPSTAATGSPSALAVARGTAFLSAPSALGASAKAEAGMPPSVSASAAFKAYGTLTSSTRGCSGTPGWLTCTPSQRASFDVNKSCGNPSARIAPSSTV